MDAELDMALSDASLRRLMSGGDLTLGGEDGLGARVATRRRASWPCGATMCSSNWAAASRAACRWLSSPQPPKPGDAARSRRAATQRRRRPVRFATSRARPPTWPIGATSTKACLVEAQVTGHNTGGLECEVNHIRGFIPISQVALYRVEDLAEFVGQRMTCLVTEANPMRRNLVLAAAPCWNAKRKKPGRNCSSRSSPGQVHEGVVRKLMDFGAFVDIGGVDGLVHVSQLAWSRVNHPSEVLSEGRRSR